MFVGEVMAIRVAVTDPFTKEAVDPSEVTSIEVHFWDPGKDPRNDPSVRDSPDYGPFAAEYDTDRGAWLVHVPTEGWSHGRLAYRVTVEGSAYLNWTYGSTRLRE